MNKFKVVSSLICWFFLIFICVGCAENISDALEVFKTRDLLFTLAKSNDVDRIVHMYDEDKNDMKFYFGRVYSAHFLMEHVRQAVTYNESFLKTGSWRDLTWKINSKYQNTEGEKLIGTIAAQKVEPQDFHLPPNYEQMLIGKRPVNMAFFINKDVQGRGYGTEACKAFVAHIFKNSDVKAIVSISKIKNEASKKSSLKCGFTLVGQYFDLWAGEQHNFLLMER